MTVHLFVHRVKKTAQEKTDTWVFTVVGVSRLILIVGWLVDETGGILTCNFVSKTQLLQVYEVCVYVI